MPSLDFTLYMIGDRKQCAGRTLPEVVQAALQAGVSAIQFREKDLSLKAQFKLAFKIRDITHHFGAKLLINDRIDLCLTLGAEGVHLPSSGLPISVARALLGPHRLIGISCHSEKDVRNAEAEGADFAVLGPVYETPSKRAYGPPLGLSAFKSIRKNTSLPLFALGGIKKNCLKAVFAAGADGVAMVSEISAAEDVVQQCQALLEEIKRARKASRL